MKHKVMHPRMRMVIVNRGEEAEMIEKCRVGKARLLPIREACIIESFGTSGYSCVRTDRQWNFRGMLLYEELH